MTVDQVNKCIPFPPRINRTTTANGIHEQWIVGKRFYYLDNGILTAIQE